MATSPARKRYDDLAARRRQLSSGPLGSKFTDSALRKRMLKVTIMRLLLIAFFLFTGPVMILRSQPTADFFPLSVGTVWKYSVSSTEVQYFNLSEIWRKITDSGTVEYSVLSGYSIDSAVIWTIHERDSVFRHIEISNDTSFLIRLDTTFELYEFSDSLHELRCQSLRGPFSFPVLWYYNPGPFYGEKIFRFGRDSTFHRITEQRLDNYLTKDTLLFQKNVGLVSAVFGKYRGPMVPYTYTETAILISIQTAVTEETFNVPIAYRLMQNYPNPFNPSTTIEFTNPEAVLVTLSIFDLLGRHVETLVNEEMKPRAYTVKWDAGNLPSGVYFYRIRAGNYVNTKKLLLLR